MADSRQLCTFVLEDLFFGIDVKHVQEVIRYQEMTAVPLAPPIIRGLINLRGQIVTALDMRARFGIQPRADGELPMNVVVRSADGVVSMLVDEIGDVLEVDERAFERTPETLAARFREHVRGVYKLDGKLLLLLDGERVAASADVTGKGEAA